MGQSESVEAVVPEKEQIEKERNSKIETTVSIAEQLPPKDADKAATTVTDGAKTDSIRNQITFVRYIEHATVEQFASLWMNGTCYQDWLASAPHRHDVTSTEENENGVTDILYKIDGSTIADNGFSVFMAESRRAIRLDRTRFIANVELQCLRGVPFSDQFTVLFQWTVACVGHETIEITVVGSAKDRHHLPPVEKTRRRLLEYCLREQMVWFKYLQKTLQQPHSLDLFHACRGHLLACFPFWQPHSPERNIPFIVWRLRAKLQEIRVLEKRLHSPCNQQDICLENLIIAEDICDSLLLRCSSLLGPIFSSPHSSLTPAKGEAVLEIFGNDNTIQLHQKFIPHGSQSRTELDDEMADMIPVAHKFVPNTTAEFLFDACFSGNDIPEYGNFYEMWLRSQGFEDINIIPWEHVKFGTENSKEENRRTVSFFTTRDDGHGYIRKVKVTIQQRCRLDDGALIIDSCTSLDGNVPFATMMTIRTKISVQTIGRQGVYMSGGLHFDVAPYILKCAEARVHASILAETKTMLASLFRDMKQLICYNPRAKLLRPKLVLGAPENDHFSTFKRQALGSLEQIKTFTGAYPEVMIIGDPVIREQLNDLEEKLGAFEMLYHSGKLSKLPSVANLAASELGRIGEALDIIINWHCGRDHDMQKLMLAANFSQKESAL